MVQKGHKIAAVFGGESIATAAKVLQVIDILASNSEIKVVIVSAPGSRWENDGQTTDHLQRWYEAAQRGESTDCQPRVFSQRFTAIASHHFNSWSYKQYENELNKELRSLAKAFYEKGLQACSLDYVLSRGEYFMGKLLAKILGWEFVDVADLVCLDENGVIDMNGSCLNIRETLIVGHKYIVPDQNNIARLIAKAMDCQIQDWGAVLPTVTYPD